MNDDKLFLMHEFAKESRDESRKRFEAIEKKLDTIQNEMSGLRLTVAKISAVSSAIFLFLGDWAKKKLGL